jgi:hypothetical protein
VATPKIDRQRKTPQPLAKLWGGSGGLGQNRTADTRIFNAVGWSFFLENQELTLEK